MTSTPRRATALLAAATLCLVACGGDEQSADTESAPAEAATNDAAADGTATGEDGGENTGSAESEPSEPADLDDPSNAGVIGGPGDYEPSDVNFRSVNLLDEPVDIYVRTNGVVRAFLIEENVQPGAVTGFAAPPDEGRYVITEAGAGDPTCVIDCDHFVGELFGFPDEGPTRTVLLYVNGFDERRAIDMWEEAPEAKSGSSNYMEPADSSTALVVVHADTIGTDEFLGYRITTDALDGCLDPYDESGALIGGNQTVPFALDAAREFSIHDNADKDCSGEPVGGPFAFAGAPGSRDHVVLTGEPGAIDALILPMSNSAGSIVVASDGDSAPADASDEATTTSPERDEAIALMGDEVAANFALDAAQSMCVAALIVDAIGPEVLVVDGVLVDLDSFDDSVNALAGQALADSVGACDVDPAAFG